MEPKVWSSLLALAPARFRAYMAGTDRDELDSLARYQYNLSLCQAMYPLLSAVEIGIRSTIHNALVSYHGRSDWYDQPGLLLPSDAQRILEAKRKVRSRRRDPTMSWRL